MSYAKELLKTINYTFMKVPEEWTWLLGSTLIGVGLYLLITDVFGCWIIISLGVVFPLWHFLGPVLALHQAKRITIGAREASEKLGFPLDRKTGFERIVVFPNSEGTAFTSRSSKDCFISLSEWESPSNEELIGTILHEWGHHKKWKLGSRERFREEVLPASLFVAGSIIFFPSALFCILITYGAFALILGHFRIKEKEADMYARSEGYGIGLANSLRKCDKRIEPRNRALRALLELFRTHPFSSKRIAYLEE